MRNVAPDMRKMDTDSVHFRPFLSPIDPQNSAPMGRMTKEMANTAKVPMRSAVVGSSAENSTAEMMTA